jgi:hypothetical protein
MHNDDARFGSRSGRPVFAVLAVGLLACGACSTSDSAGGSSGGSGTSGSSGTSGTGSSSGTSGTSGSGGTSGTSGASGAPPSDAGACASDPLKTNLPPLFNGNSVDSYDCPILTYTATYGEPDAMVFKAIIYVESRFQFDAVGCTGNGPCCPAKGWTASECACLGAMQTGPACSSSSTLGLLPSGHVDLDKDPTSPDWANSVFNPVVNIELGIAGIAGNRAQVKKQFPGCTEDQYTMMAVGNFNSYGSTKSCTVYNSQYDNSVLDAYKQYAAASGWPAHAY